MLKNPSVDIVEDGELAVFNVSGPRSEKGKKIREPKKRKPNKVMSGEQGTSSDDPNIRVCYTCFQRE